MDNGIIDLQRVQYEIEMSKRKEYLKQHPYSIWQGKDSKWRTYLPDQSKSDGRALLKRTTKEALEDAVVEYWKSEDQSPALEKIFYDRLNKKLEFNEIAKGTYDRYENDFKRFYKDDRNFGSLRIKNVRENDVVHFIKESIVKHNLTNKSYANLRLVTSELFKQAKSNGYISWSISQLLSDMQISKRSFKKVIKEDFEEVYSDEEMSIMMEYIQGNADLYNLAIMLMFVTGLRIGEVVTLKWEDFNGIGLSIKRTEIKYKDENDKIKYEIKEFPKTEAGVRTAIIPETYLWIMRKLRTLNSFGEFIFQNGDTWVRTYQIFNRLEKLCKKLGIYYKSPHKIRKTYCTILLDNKVDNNLIVQQVGHTNILTTEMRYHRNRKSLKTKAEIISNIPEFSVETERREKIIQKA